MRSANWVRAATAVVATAALGGVATDPGSSWYRMLDKPRWQPPPVAFPVVWTPLYALLAVAGARVLDRTDGDDDPRRQGFVRAYGLNLVLNAGWTAVFFRARRPTAALVEILALDVSTWDLVRRAGRIDRAAAAAIAPYAGWTLFATALNAAIAVRNRRR